MDNHPHRPFATVWLERMLLVFLILFVLMFLRSQIFIPIANIWHTVQSTLP